MNRDLRIKLVVRLVADDCEGRFGPRIATLLEQVRNHHSLRSAAASMGMAYSKAWRIIRAAESTFGCKFLDSTIGGKGGGGAVLTPEAEHLLSAYQSYVADLNDYAQKKFEESFSFLTTEE